MKKGFVCITLLVACGFLLSFINTTIGPELSINSTLPLPDEKLKDVSGKEITLRTSKTEKGLLIIFSCNTCPYVKLSEGRIKQITDNCIKTGIGCIIINSNEAQRLDNDSFGEMQKYATAQKYNCSYVLDTQSKLADAFGATHTPQCFLFNAKSLVYKGAIDDNVKDITLVKYHYLKNAIDAILKNEIPRIQETKFVGCTIKRVE